MVDVITDTEIVTVNIILHADIDVLNVVAPTQVEAGEPFDITYDCTNNGEMDDCFGQAVMDAVVVAGTRWDESIDAGATVSKTATIPGITENKDITIEAGYTK